MPEYIGLTSKKAEELLKEYGENKLPEKKKSILKKFLSWVVSPVSLMLIAASVLSLVDGNTADFYIISGLFFANFLISIWHEGKADKSIRKMQEHLSFKVKVLRDSAWTEIDSVLLVPGDIVSLKIGTVVPADISLIETNNLSVNESVLTGESLPKEKKPGDTAYSGSFVTKGQAVGSVLATGGKTSFGKTAGLAKEERKKSSLEKDIISISKFVSIISVVVVIILTIILILAKASLNDVFTLDLSLLIAGIPIALPTVMSLIISIGVLELAKKHAIVRRLASLEDLANVNLLLSDKTGTLTENKIFVEKIIPFGNYSEKEIMALSLSTITDPDADPLDRAVAEKAKELGAEIYKRLNFTPADSERKRSTATLLINGTEKTASLGAPQIIESLSKMNPELKEKFDNAVADAAKEGYRVHALSLGENGKEENMELAGIMLLSDKVREDAKSTIKFMNEYGIGVKMVTGDNILIGKRVASMLDIRGEMYDRSVLHNPDWLNKNLNSAAGFAEVLPEDKYNLVKFSQARYTVAVTGDGINDLPAVKSADVGFAVNNAVDALKSTADIMLLSGGIAVIKDTIVEARKIFVRLYNYSLYNISESFRVIITIAVIGLLYKTYPLTPVQLIILAFLNDIPIVSLAFDKVKISMSPSHINPKKRFTLSTLFGLIGVVNSLLLLFLMLDFFHLPWNIIQTVFFLKLTVSGHMLIYVAHTEEKWYKFLPSKQVIIAIFITQFIATAFALLGIFTTKISIAMVIFVWIWCFFFMQIGELMKTLQNKFLQKA